MYGLSSSHVWMWELDHNEHWRIDAFKLWCWRRLLRVPWTERRSNQSILKEISPEYSLEGLMLKLKLQCFGYLMQRADSLEKTLMLGKIGGRRRRRWQCMRWLDGITNSMDVNFSKPQETVGFPDSSVGKQSTCNAGASGGQRSLVCCSQWGHSQTRLNNWTTTMV